jgi:ribonuclease BN (tRNA processing enzyme)
MIVVVKIKKFIEEKIKEAFKEGEKIDILFISHFHNDHINGIEFLLEYCDVKEVILPFLHDNMKLQFVIENVKSRANNQFLIDTIINPKDTFKNQEVTFIEPFDIDVNNTNMSSYISSNKIESKYINDWIYIPCNIYHDEFAKTLEIELINNSIDISNIVEEIKADKIKILKIYKSVFGRNNFNSNSMIIYSGLKKDINLKLQNTTFLNIDIFLSEKVGCLYLGDAELKEDIIMRKLKYLLKDYWNNISVVQIPHHGSYKNFNDELAWKDSISIISTGFRYSHPSSKVIEDIKANESKCAVVSYDKNTQVIQHIQLEYIVEKYHPEYLI